MKSLKSFLRTIRGGGPAKSPTFTSSITPSATTTTSSKSRSSSRTRQPSDPAPGSGGAVSKLPLKRVTQSVNPLTGAGSRGAAGRGAAVEVEAGGGEGGEQEDGGAGEAGELGLEFREQSQEVYREHRAALALLSLAPLGDRLASCDTNGVIKVTSSAERE